MHWVDVDGYPMPVLLAGHPGLELCNTWAGWSEPPGPHREWLRSYQHLAVWSRHAGLLDAATVARLRPAATGEPAAAERVLTEIRELRTALHDVLLDPANRAAFRTVAGYAERAAATARLRVDATGLARWTLPGDAGLDLPLLACAQTAAELLGTPTRALVRACPGDDCGWLFVDTRGRRRWCSMAVCGNRAKVRAYADRH
ncbi:CGNR zinc finger domain-containing protein [Micromonospora cathayae]|uniref:CGNR zinc finger domain-containing protein n=1 Tax=Micromonospora cathayae TaxID=3028804 RepID=A0ABY7ZQI4_9ACTN|nr:CGNR zinc finger domain-containing protein [Micromonospora sp. HUAS 3]WDZ85280.1 CGNR zinc finger domain-containing protein [Micromonospora sp. HUAS 3]